MKQVAYVWLRLVFGHIQEEYEINTIIYSPSVIFEDNNNLVEAS